MASFEDLCGGSYNVDGIVEMMRACTIGEDIKTDEVVESSSNEDIIIRSSGPASVCADDEDASLDVYRLGFIGFNRQRRARRVPSIESETASNDNLVAGPPMLDFNEPLPNILADEIREPNPINGGDVGFVPGGRERSLVHTAISNSSFEDLQSVVSQLDLETSSHNFITSKSSCHSQHHISIHGPHHGTCCRNTVHNISLESLDLDTNSVGIGHGHMNHCCNHPQNRFKRSLSMSKRTYLFFP